MIPSILYSIWYSAYKGAVSENMIRKARETPYGGSEAYKKEKVGDKSTSW